MIISIISSIVIYALSIVLLKNYIDVSDFDLEFVMNLMYVTFASWLPPFVFKIIKKTFDPSDYEKVMQHKKTKKINFKIK